MSFARLTLSTLALVGAIVWTIAAVFGPKNIALHSKVSLSTYYPGTPDPSHLVDGLRDTNVGAHTKVEDNPWILVELPGTFNVGKMRIYGRNDGYFDESLPIVLEVGEGNGPLVEVARRTEALSESNPWDVSFPVRRISKVKFTTPKHGYLALGELEVYGKPAR